ESRRAVFVRYLQAYREVVDWMYADKAAVKAFADWARVPEAIARLAPEDYYPKNNVLPDRIEGLDLAMADAVSFKYIATPLSKEQLATLILFPSSSCCGGITISPSSDNRCRLRPFRCPGSISTAAHSRR